MSDEGTKAPRLRLTLRRLKVVPTVQIMVATGMGKGEREDRPGAPAPGGFEFELHSPDYEVPSDVRDYAHDKLVAKLHKFGARVLSVIVRMKDLTGPKGGEDKVCRAEAILSALQPVVVEERHHDIRAALDLAIDGLQRAVQREIERRRTLPRQRGRKAVRNAKLAGP